MYSVFKELDYATSLLNGPYKDSGLGEAFQKAMALSSSEDVVLTDFRQYLPSYQAPASFIGCLIFDDGKKVGAAVFQIPVAKVADIMGARDGLVHISELAPQRVKTVGDVVNEGDMVKVKCIGIDDRGKVKLSMKAVDQETGEDLQQAAKAS